MPDREQSNDEDMQVNRCVCFDVRFTRLKRWLEQNGCSIPNQSSEATEAAMRKLQQQFGCGKGCGLCQPYIEAMIRTGRTAFPPMATHTLQSLKPEDGNDGDRGHTMDP